MYESHWDKEKKQPRSKSVMAFGYVDDLISTRSPTLSLITQTLSQRKMKSVPQLSPRIPVRARLPLLSNTILGISFSIRF